VKTKTACQRRSQIKPSAGNLKGTRMLTPSLNESIQEICNAAERYATEHDRKASEFRTGIAEVRRAFQLSNLPLDQNSHRQWLIDCAARLKELVEGGAV
jgi:hypothetical protein